MKGTMAPLFLTVVLRREPGLSLLGNLRMSGSQFRSGLEERIDLPKDIVLTHLLLFKFRFKATPG